MKYDYGNTFKQIKEQIGGNFKKIEESINNLQTNFDQNKTRNTQYYKGSTGVDRNMNAACFHCAKPNHSYRDCRNATESEIETITNLLKARNFDYIKFNERVKEMQSRYKPFTIPLNSRIPTI